MVQAKHAVLGSERSQLQGRLAILRQEAEASQQATAALDSRNLTGEALLSKVTSSQIRSSYWKHFLGKYSHGSRSAVLARREGCVRPVHPPFLRT